MRALASRQRVAVLDGEVEELRRRRRRASSSSASRPRSVVAIVYSSVSSSVLRCRSAGCCPRRCWRSRSSAEDSPRRPTSVGHALAPPALDGGAPGAVDDRHAVGLAVLEHALETFVRSHLAHCVSPFLSPRWRILNHKRRGKWKKRDQPSRRVRGSPPRWGLLALWAVRCKALSRDSLLKAAESALDRAG